MEHNYFVKYKNIELRPLEDIHIERLRVWRNDKAQTKYLRKISYITQKMQKSWFKKYKTNKDIYTFVIYENGIRDIIGSLSLYDFKINCAEIGKLQIGEKKALGHGFGAKSFAMLLKLAFEEFKVYKVVATVNINNIAAQKSYFKLGFVSVGEVGEGELREYKIEIDKDKLINKINYYDEIKIES